MRIDERKALLRRIERKRWLTGATARERERKGRLIQGRFLSAFPPGAGRKVALYAAVRGEVDTERIRNVCLAVGAAVFYPVLGAEGNLLFYPHGAGDGWVEGRFGLREPEVAPGAEGLKGGFDVVIVPGLAFDAKGRRLGQGYGSYDRFLFGLGGSALTVGLAYAWQLVEEVPADDWDVPVDVVVTEEGILRAAGDGLLRERLT